MASLRHHHPNNRILITKVDWKSAYRRVHLVAAMAVQSIVAVSGMLLLALRLTFGRAANPFHWSDVSEIATNLANDLVRRPDWPPFLPPTTLSTSISCSRPMTATTPSTPPHLLARHFRWAYL